MMDTSGDISELAKALVKAQSEFEAVAKNADNPFFKSKYADLPAVVKAASPILAANGLSVLQSLGWFEDKDTLTTRLLHETGQWVEDTMRLHLTKQDAQGHGSAITYARRYSYMAILGLVADVDDDGNAASKTPAAKKSAGTTKRAAPVAQAEPSTEPPAAGKGPNLGYLFSLLDGMADEDRHTWASKVLGREVTSFSDLTQREVNKLVKDRAATKTQSTEYADDDNERPF